MALCAAFAGLAAVLLSPAGIAVLSEIVAAIEAVGRFVIANAEHLTTEAT